MALFDQGAADDLADRRKALGLSPENLADAIALESVRSPWGERGRVNAHTIRRIEATGHVPGVRVQFVLAAYFGLVPHQIWKPGRARTREATAA